MFWIAIICLLALVFWLLLEAVNERRWVEAHQDDKKVMADEGLVPTYSQLSRSAMPEGRYSINEKNSSVGRFATDMKQKTFDLGNSIEQKAAEKLKNTNNAVSAGVGGRSWSEIGNSIVGNSSMIGRATEKVSKKALEVGEKIPTEKLKPTLRNKSAPAEDPSGAVGRFIKNVSNRVEEIDRKVDAKA